MILSNYFDVFAKDPVFSVVMKPADALSVRLAPLAQIIRGALLALAIYPFGRCARNHFANACLFPSVLQMDENSWFFTR